MMDLKTRCSHLGSVEEFNVVVEVEMNELNAIDPPKNINLDPKKWKSLCFVID